MKTLPLIVMCAAMYVVSLSGCASRLQPMITPSFDTASIGDSNLREAIIKALSQRDWAITAKKPGRIEAFYRKVGGASAKIAVVYGRGHVEVRHIDSTGLDFTDVDGGKYIHRTYNNWMRNLEQDILVQAGLY